MKNKFIYINGLQNKNGALKNILGVGSIVAAIFLSPFAFAGGAPSGCKGFFNKVSKSGSFSSYDECMAACTSTPTDLGDYYCPNYCPEYCSKNSGSGSVPPSSSGADLGGAGDGTGGSGSGTGQGGGGSDDESNSNNNNASGCDDGGSGGSGPNGDVGDPINAAVGNLHETETDFVSKIGTLPLKIVRTYNSRAQSSGIFGNNWASNLDAHLVIQLRTITATMPDGKQVSFTLRNGTWFPNTTIPLTLTQNNGGYTIATLDQLKLNFDQAGKMSSVVNARNELMTFNYNAQNQLASVEDNFGNLMSFTYYSGTNLVNTISAMGNTYTYAYKMSGIGIGNLQSVSSTVDSVVATRQYRYENISYPNALTGLIDENNNRYSTWTYNNDGLANSSQHSGTSKVTVDYTHLNDSQDPYSVVSNSASYQWEYHVQVASDGRHLIQRIAGRGSANCPASTHYAYFDANDFPEVLVKDAGNATKLTYDSQRAIVTVKESGFNYPVSASTQAIYPSKLVESETMQMMQITALDPVFPYPKQIIYSGKNGQGQWLNTKQVDATYDTINGRLTSWKETDLTSYTVPYSSAGQQRTWEYIYTYFDTQESKVQTKEVRGPRYSSSINDVTTLKYDVSGHLVNSTDGSAHSFTYSQFTQSGLPTLVSDDGNGVQSLLGYNERDQIKSVTMAFGTPLAEKYQLSYYSNGLLQQIIRPDGSWIKIYYDAAQNLQEIDNSSGEKLSFTPSTLNGQWTSVKLLDNGGGQRALFQRTFDDFGRLMQIIGSKGEASFYAYDANGNIETTEEGGSATTMVEHVYDALDRISKLEHQKSDNSGLEDYVKASYDPQGNLAAVVDAIGHSTGYTFDGLNNLMVLSSPDAGTKLYWHDAAGNTTMRKDGKGQILSYQFDSINRLINISRADTGRIIAAYTYDQVDGVHGRGYGRLTSVSDLSGSTDFSYDAVGHVVGKIQVTGGVTLATQYSYYPGTNNVSTMTLPSGNTIQYVWTNGRISALSLLRKGSEVVQPLVTVTGWQPFGGPLAWALGNGETAGRSYNQDNQISADPVESQLNYNATMQLSDATLGGASNIAYTGFRSYSYDNYDHATALSGSVSLLGAAAGPLSLGYNYDQADNLLTASSGSNSYVYNLDPSSNRIGSIRINNEPEQFYYYDDNGSVLSVGTSTPVYTYDFTGRLVQFNNGGLTANYLYNGFGERVQKTVANATSLFFYGEKGQLIGEYASDGSVLQETIYLDSLPIAVITQGGIYYVHADYRGVPRQIDDANQVAVWAWDPLMYGDQAPNENPNGLGLFTYNLRFPGQYYDSESGKNYNYFRDYDSSTGRYLESDPLGLMAGVNSYAYVKSEPLGHIDLLGLIDFCVSGLCSSNYGNSQGSIVLEPKISSPLKGPMSLESCSLEYKFPGSKPTSISAIEAKAANLFNQPVSFDPSHNGSGSSSVPPLPTPIVIHPAPFW